MTGYSAGMLNERVTFIRLGKTVNGPYGRTRQDGEEVERWAAVDWVRGAKPMQEGVTDAYDVVMIRCRYDEQITRDCKVRHNGTIYRIENFRADKRRGTIQMQAKEIDS
ncbi:MAG: phage head closure protein [Paludibacteraceae bacterium]|nr:phage head closure protein [Paludibacteraceae bacterium]